jgi:hypothetical protein
VGFGCARGTNWARVVGLRLEKRTHRTDRGLHLGYRRRLKETRQITKRTPPVKLRFMNVLERRGLEVGEVIGGETSLREDATAQQRSEICRQTTDGPGRFRQVPHSAGSRLTTGLRMTEGEGKARIDEMKAFVYKCFSEAGLF